MNGSTEHQASGASNSAGRREIVYNLGTSRRMLPLLRQIVGDLIRHRQERAKLLPEQGRLDRGRIGLDWSGRQRRYQIHEEVANLERQYQETQVELDELGIVVIDANEGRVGLPTIVNRQLAYFSWKLGEDVVRHWHFPGEEVRRLIPANWKESGEARTPVKS